MADGFIAVELDLMGAVMHQLIPALDSMDPAPLTAANAQALPDAQGVYLPIHDGEVRYVGKTDAEAGLRARLARHARKFEQRRNVRPQDVGFKAAQILVLTAMGIETLVIRHYGAEWNGSGFGSNAKPRTDQQGRAGIRLAVSGRHRHPPRNPRGGPDHGARRAGGPQDRATLHAAV